MTDRLDYYFRQEVTEAELDLCIAYEEAVHRAAGVRRYVDLADLMSDAVA